MNIFKTDPFDHQLRAFNKVRSMIYAALFMEQGTGKTKVDIDRSAHLFSERKIDGKLVLCPNSLTETWWEELETHCGVPYLPVIWDSNLTKKKQAEVEKALLCDRKQLPVIIMNIEAIRTQKGSKVAHWFLNHKRIHLSMDESSKIKSPSAAQTVAAVNLARHATARTIMTGTPIDKSPADFFSQLEFLNPFPLGFSNYYSFRARYCQLSEKVITFRKPRRDKKGRQKKTRKIIEITGTQREDELKANLLPFSVFEKKDDCLDLPPKIYHKHVGELSGEAKRIYESVKTQIITEIDNDRELTVEYQLAKLIRLQQVVGGFLPSDDDPNAEAIPGKNQKIDLLLQCTEEFPGPALIWSRFQAEHKAIQKALLEVVDHSRIGFITGPTDKALREDNRRAFQRGKIKYLICSQSCAGYGYTLTKAENEFFFSNTFSHEQRVQSEDRAHRIGLAHKVNIVDLLMAGTIDYKLFQTLKDKKDLSDRLMDVKDIEELI